MEGEYYYKYNKRNQFNLLFRSNEYDVILNYIKEYLIIKYPQIICLYEFNKIVNKPNYNDEKEELYNLCTKCKSYEEFNKYNLNKMNIEYIQGIFDAEGCIYIDKKTFAYNLSISQKNNHVILHSIMKYLGFGVVQYETTFIIHKKENCLYFISLMKSGCIVKYNQLVAFEKLLNTSDKQVKKQMYLITNEEKHKIEIFTELNQNEKGKESYMETVKLNNIKKNLIRELKTKFIYQEKSEKMKGEGNHNFGKKFTQETKQKMSASIREAKGGVCDETICKVKQLLNEGKKNIEIQELLNLPRHTVTRIKNGHLVCVIEIKTDTKKLTQEEININRRKIKLTEILVVINNVVNNIKPGFILNILNEERIKNNNKKELTIDIVKNIKREINKNKMPIYEFELTNNEYLYYKGIINQYYECLCKTKFK
jgi:hypothetical protein